MGEAVLVVAVLVAAAAVVVGKRLFVLSESFKKESIWTPFFLPDYDTRTGAIQMSTMIHSP